MIIVGLGNPGEGYEGTRHNAGRDAVLNFAKKQGFDELEFDKKSNALVVSSKIGRGKATLVLPETFMNKSGAAVAKFVTSAKKAKDLIVVQDELDLPLGRAKMSFNKSSGGHKGVESVIKAVKTEEFYRIRIGISKPGPKGSVKKPSHDDLMNNFIIDPFKPAEADEIKKVFKKIAEALEIAVAEGAEKAMGVLNSNF